MRDQSPTPVCSCHHLPAAVDEDGDLVCPFDAEAAKATREAFLDLVDPHRCEDEVSEW